MDNLNQDRGVAADLLRKLLSSGSDMAKGGGEEILKFITSGEGLGVAARVAGTASVAPAENILTDAANKELIKLRKEQVRGAAEQGMPLEDIQKQVNTMDSSSSQGQPTDTSPYGTGTNPPTKSQMSGMLNQPQGQPEAEQPKLLSEILQSMGVKIEQGGGFFDQGGVTQNEDGTMTFRMAGKGPASQNIDRGMKALQDLIGVADTSQKLSGEEPLQKGDKEKLELETFKTAAIEEYRQNRLDEREKIKASLKGDNNTQSAALAIHTANSLVDLRNSISMRGPFRGRVGGALGAVGIGTEQRAEFESMANQFVFDVGSLLGQKGRAFTEKEQELVRKKVTQASLSAKDEDFRGRMKSVLNRINGIAGENLFSMDGKGKIVINQATTSSQSNSMSTSPGVKQNVDQEYERYLNIIGG